jgi:hypothetical protein
VLYWALLSLPPQSSRHAQRRYMLCRGGEQSFCQVPLAAPVAEKCHAGWAAAFRSPHVYPSLVVPAQTACPRRPWRRGRRVCVAVATQPPSARAQDVPGISSASAVSQRPDFGSSEVFKGDASWAREGDGGGALERESASERYMDLRTLKKAAWKDVRIAAKSSADCRFGPFNSAVAVAALSDDILFGPDTVPLSRSQQAAVRALLSRRSVLYPSALPDREAVVADLSFRAREWKQTIVHCAPTQRAAEAMYIAVCAMGLGDKQVALDVGLPMDAASEGAALVITIPRVLRRSIVDLKSSWWMAVADLMVLDDILSPSITEWEEIILGMPSRVLLCIFETELSSYEEDEMPLWLETVQNGIVPISPRSSGRFLDRIDRPADAPLAQAYIFNAARHYHPVQLSLPRVLEDLEKELTMQSHTGLSGRRGTAGEKPKKKGRQGKASHPSTRNIEDVLRAGEIDFSKSLLDGVEVLTAEDVTRLSFEDESHAVYADFAALVLADAQLTAEGAGRMQRASKARRKTAAAIATAAARRQKRKGALLLPAIAFAHGSAETECAAVAMLSSLEDSEVDLICDRDARDLLTSALVDFVEKHERDLTSGDTELVEMLGRGVGVVHDGILPALSSLAQELFRESLVQVLCVDSHLDVLEVLALPRARSVLVQSCVLAEDNDKDNGLIKGSLLGTLAGRPGVDEVGNIVGLWYDNEVDDAEACETLAAALFTRDLTSRHARSRFEHDQGTVSPSPSFGFVDSLPGLHRSSPYVLSSASVRNGRIARRKSGLFLTTYSGLLGSIRRYGYEGYADVVDYALDSYRGWLVGASLRATREKVEVQQRAVNDHLEDVSWDELATHDRLEAKLNEQVRMYRAMSAKKEVALAERTLSILKSSPAGSLIGLCSSRERLLPPTEVEEGGDWNGSISSDESAGPTQYSGGLLVNDGAGHIEGALGEQEGHNVRQLVSAILVSVLENNRAQLVPAFAKSIALVLCILADGIWTLAPAEDVVAYSPDAELVSNVDLIPVPHIASFDTDPVTLWAKCKPVADEEIGRLSAVAEELVSILTSSSNPMASLTPFQLPEFDKQEARVKAAQDAYRASPWCGREAQITDLRRLRRRALELADDASALRASESRMAKSMEDSRSDLDSGMHAKLAVLEDCNAVCVPSADSLEMTPIGALASVLPCPFPLFSAACVLLVSRLEDLSVGQMAAFVHILIDHEKGELVMPNFRQGVDRHMFDSILSDNSGIGSSASAKEEARVDMQEKSTGKEDDLKGVLPGHVLQEVEDIRSALHVVQRRHFDSEPVSRKNPRIAPQKVRSQCARAIRDFVDGSRTWTEIAEREALPAGDLVRLFRACAETLTILSAESTGLGELSDLHASIRTAAMHLAVWPILDLADWKRLAESGFGARPIRRKKLSYKAWWERSAEAIHSAIEESQVEVETAVAEIVDSTEA